MGFRGQPLRADPLNYTKVYNDKVRIDVSQNKREISHYTLQPKLLGRRRREKKKYKS